MHVSILILAFATSVMVMASPTYPELTSSNGMPGVLETVSSYFNLLSDKIQQARQSAAAPTCDLSRAVFPFNGKPTTHAVTRDMLRFITNFDPAALPSLPPPSPGLFLKHVAIGRGTQNYTCDADNATAVPIAAGALATLFNASCIAATYPDVLNLLPRVVLPFNLTNNDITADETRLFPTNLKLSGHHYFETATTPFFNLDTFTAHMGRLPCAKNNTQKAPSATAIGSETDNRGQQGEPAVPWLKLVAKAGATGGLQEAYRLQTMGGSAPSTCAGMPAAFTVQYAAQYWFYARR
ncbi:hypothetical protein SEPCBS57363_000885 [Sporothrix epigloea]|uniref:Malate dehydrogenase n=1 Tax=Sporothrix epigloea TaxID=1892477 RepID=A0ABP0D9S7_9PEZI